MASRADRHSRLLGEVLAACCGSIEAVIDEDWVALAATVRDTAAEAIGWRLLEMNAQFIDGVRGCSNTAGLRLRADLPLLYDDAEGERVDGAALTQRVRSARDSMCVAVRTLAGASDHVPHLNTRKPVPAGGDDKRAPLAELCAAAAWPFTERSADSLIIELEVPDGPAHVHLARVGPSAIRARFDLIRNAEIDSPSRAAISLFLIGAGDVLRFVRPAAERTEKGFDLRLEVVWAETPSAAELSRALEALSVGRLTVAREVDALRDESVALAYLRMRGIEKWDVQAA